MQGACSGNRSTRSPLSLPCAPLFAERRPAPPGIDPDSRNSHLVEVPFLW
jgi:hypothetical protein